MSDFDEFRERRQGSLKRGNSYGRRASDHLKPWYKRPGAIIVVLLSLLLSTVVAAGLLIFFNLAYDEAKCDAYSAETGRETRYTKMVGCMIKVPGGWIPKEELRQVQRLNP